MNTTHRPVVLALLLLVGLSTAYPAAAQLPVEYRPGGSVMDRAELEVLLEQYEDAALSPAYSETIRSGARAAAQRIRQRLEEGDFQVGDRVVLDVEGETALPDTVPVEPGPRIDLPLFGSISLEGVLRSEITAHLTAELGRVIRNPVVRAQALMRLSVQGAVGSPGFYAVPSDMLLSEAIMFAGGPAPGADLEALQVERGGNQLLTEEEVQRALTEGRTLDQLSLQAGDQLRLPAEAEGTNIFLVIGRYALVVGSVLVLGVRVF